MDFSLNADQQEVQQLARTFATREILPHAARWDAEDRTPMEALHAAAELGLATLTLPTSLGGGGQGLLENVLAVEEIGYACAGFASALTLNELPAVAILSGGNKAQQEEYVGRIASGTFAAYGMTEPGAGSDVSGISTVARSHGSDYVLNGSKVWITNAPFAEFFVIFAKTDPDGGRRGISAFVVDADSPGLTVGTRLPKLGQKAAAAAEIFFNDVVVPAERRLGEEGQGFEIAMKVFDHTRPVIAAIAVGLIRRCLEESVTYATQRRTMGQQLSRHQAVAFKIADMGTQLEAARLLTYQAAWLADQGRSSSLHAAYAKLTAADAAVSAATETVQIFGGMGYSREYPAEKLYRDAKLFQIYEGTSEIQRLIISRELVVR